MKKFLKITLFILLICIFAGTFVFLYMKSRPQSVIYSIVSPSIGNVDFTTVATGKIEPRNEVLIKPQINGIVSEIYKKAGEHVKKDEVIAKVKVIPDMATLNSAESAVRLAEINMKQADIDHNRMQNLYDKRLISDEEYEKSIVSWQQAKEELSNRKSALEIVRDGISSNNTSFSTTLVRSTIDGLILDIPVRVGNSVIMSNTMNDGTTVASVANMNDLLFKGMIDETEVAMLEIGMPVSLSIGALQGETFKATLEYISPKAVESNGTNQFQIEAALEQTNTSDIRSGYSANASIVLEHATDVIVVSEGCIEFEDDSTYLYILQTEHPQTFSRRKVTTGISDGINIEIKEGIELQDKIRGTKQIANTK